MRNDDIVRKLAETEPYAPAETSGDPMCFFCYSAKHEPHDKDCLWLAASNLVAVKDRNAALNPKAKK